MSMSARARFSSPKSTLPSSTLSAGTTTIRSSSSSSSVSCSHCKLVTRLTSIARLSLNAVFKCNESSRISITAPMMTEPSVRRTDASVAGSAVSEGSTSACAREARVSTAIAITSSGRIRVTKVKLSMIGSEGIFEGATVRDLPFNLNNAEPYAPLC